MDNDGYSPPLLGTMEKQFKYNGLNYYIYKNVDEYSLYNFEKRETVFKFNNRINIYRQIGQLIIWFISKGIVK